ncbi:MAG: hypothetical protein M3256_09940 [Actinomycetota bacterium]|nr:hypothetical protein [Actinomycetota bacterium]
MLASQPVDGYVLEVVYLLSAAVTEMLDQWRATRRRRPSQGRRRLTTPPPHLNQGPGRTGPFRLPSWWAARTTAAGAAATRLGASAIVAAGSRSAPRRRV